MFTVKQARLVIATLFHWVRRRDVDKLNAICSGDKAWPLLSTWATPFLRDHRDSLEWRYEHKAIDGPREGTITGRVLIVKLPTHELLATHAERIYGFLARVLLVQNDGQWDCRAWMIHALAALRANGSDFSTILDVTNGFQADGELKASGDMAKDRVLKRRPSCVSDMPRSDMKVDRKCVPVLKIIKIYCRHEFIDCIDFLL
ncbi:hypothetical protein DFJ58DRAFT_916930 [Suillus subalutaceus]|uniref:uncharacterized protein n=1 Tax=Suillus subalutaceus TaxID=48586 RepID=UPI001B867701|nr:uncharacterized protein DFJ58DRAFT_916930 [Suillus subalutaceus]KAG1839531.1 hypothetical protein DFJ58DRAFT_916930 [Suillus subalutaceus]